jgi:FixJ family two-component response regulator
MTEKPPVVIIVDDDASFRSFLVRLIGTVGLKTIQFASAEEFLASAPPDCPACLVLDVQMPGLSGLDLQRQLAEADVRSPLFHDWTWNIPNRRGDESRSGWFL